MSSVSSGTMEDVRFCVLIASPAVRAILGNTYKRLIENERLQNW